MKKFSLALNIILLAGLGYIAFTGKIQWNDNPLPAKDPCNLCKDYSGMANHKFRANTLQDMATGYRNSVRLASFPNANIPKDDATNIWFNLDSLKHFIWEIESNTCGIKCGKEAKNFQLGIRIYYARYQDSIIMDTTRDLMVVPRQFAYHHTLFMVPTYDMPDPNGVRHIDFNPTGNYDYKTCKFDPIDPGSSNDILAFGAVAPLLSGANNTTNAAAFNHGRLCPPICNKPEDAVFNK